MTLLVRQLSLGRNELLHQHKDDKDQEIYSMESAKLCYNHSNPNLLQSLDQDYCNNMTLNKPLLSYPSVCRRWLIWVKTSRAAYLNDGFNQQTMNKHMISILHTRDVLTVQETRPMQTTHSAWRKNTNTTQQRMTAFFPSKVGYHVSPWKKSKRGSPI